MRHLFFILGGAQLSEALRLQEAAPRIDDKVQFLREEFQTKGSTVSLRDWLSNGECFNLALTPQYNNQHTIWGLLTTLKEEGLLKNLTGIAACSGGTIAGSFIAAGLDYKNFTKFWPRKGWLGFHPSEPKLSEDYLQFLSGLPESFEDLKIPFALSLTNWTDEDAFMTTSKKSASRMIVSSGQLREPLVAAVATGNNGAISDPWCPKCIFGMWPKKVNGMYPVTDGAFTDLWGLEGLSNLPKCSRVLNIVPLDYANQVQPPDVDTIPTRPAEVVSLTVVQPPSASLSYMLEGFGRSDITSRASEDWNDLMFDVQKKTMLKQLDEKLPFKKRKGKAGGGQIIMTVVPDINETEGELWFDSWFSKRRDQFWKDFSDEDVEVSKDWKSYIGPPMHWLATSLTDATFIREWNNDHYDAKYHLMRSCAPGLYFGAGLLASFFVTMF